MVQFTVIGSANYDLVSYSQRVPNAGETFQSDSFETHIGGKGLNQTISIAKLLPEINQNNKIRFIGKVGDDGFGRELLKGLTDQNVDVSNVEIVKGERSGVAVIIVEKTTGENRILINKGANGLADYSDSELEKFFPDNSSEVVVFQNEVPGTLNAIKWISLNRPAKTIVYNPSPYYTFSSTIIDLVDILFVNEGEAAAIAQDILPTTQFEQFQESIKDDYIQGYQDLSLKLKAHLNKKKETIVIVTLGAYGSVFTTKDPHNTVDYVKSVKVPNVVDTTGAGDTFTGAFLTRLQTTDNIKLVVEYATFASSLAIQKEGASNSIPTYKELNSKLELIK